MNNKKYNFNSKKNIFLNFQLSNLYFILILSTLTFISPTEIQVTKHAQKFLIMNVYMEYEKNALSIYNLLDSINPIYGKIKLGSNEQELIMRIRLDSYPTIINEDKELSKIFNLYNINTTKTYFKISNETYTSKEFFKGILSSDLITFSDKEKMEGFHFFYADQLSEKLKMSAGIIGLDIKRRNALYGPKFHSHSINFVDQLQSNQIIDEYGATIILDRKNRRRGKLFLGPDLDDIFDEFKDCLKTRVKAGDDTNENFMKWGFIFDSVKLGENLLKESKKVELSFDNDFILSTDEYSYLIMDLFFKELIEKKVCTMEDLSISYYKYIKCKDIVLGALDRFPTLTFIGTDVNFDQFHIDFTAQDLFENIDGTVYFKVIIMKPISESMIANAEWRIGKIFFRKYVVTLDRRRKTITFYTHTHLSDIYSAIHYNDDKNEKETKNLKKSNVISSYNIMFIVVIALGIIFTSIAVFFNKRKLIKNKKRNKNLVKNNNDGEEMSYYFVES